MRQLLLNCQLKMCGELLFQSRFYQTKYIPASLILSQYTNPEPHSRIAGGAILQDTLGPKNLSSCIQSCQHYYGPIRDVRFFAAFLSPPSTISKYILISMTPTYKRCCNFESFAPTPHFFMKFFFVNYIYKFNFSLK